MTRSDTVVIILMIILLSFLYLKYWTFDTNKNNYAQITITGAPLQKILLNDNRTIKISGRIGETSIQIKDKKIRFLHSPCTKKYCIHSGWLKRTGSIAACIPNGITISIKNTKNLFDAINF